MPNKNNAQQNHQAQMLNFNQMIEEAFNNWPLQTAIGQDTLTWLPQDELNRICEKLTGNTADFVACTDHIGATQQQLLADTFPFSESNTYMLDSLPQSIWKDVGRHEGVHHSTTSGKQAMAYDATQNGLLYPDLKDTIEAIFYKGYNVLDSLNNAVDDDEWLKWYENSLPKVEKHDYEPLINRTLLDYDNAIDELLENYRRSHGK